MAKNHKIRRFLNDFITKFGELATEKGGGPWRYGKTHTEVRPPKPVP